MKQFFTLLSLSTSIISLNAYAVPHQFDDCAQSDVRVATHASPSRDILAPSHSDVQDSTEELRAFAQQFFTEDMPPFYKALIRHELTKVAEEDRSAFARDVQIILAGDLATRYKPAFFKAVTSIAPEERPLILDNVHLFANEAIDGYDDTEIMPKIITALSQVTADSLQSLIKLLQHELNGVMEGYYQALSMEPLSTIAEDDRLVVIQAAKELFLDSMEGGHKLNIIKALCKVSLDDRPAFIQDIGKLISGDLGYETGNIIYGLAKVPAVDRSAIFDICSQLFNESTTTEVRDRTMKVFLENPEAAKAEVLDDALQLFTDDMTPFDKAELMAPVAKISTDVANISRRAARQRFVQSTKELLTNVDDSYKSLMLHAFCDIPAVDQPSVIQAAQQLYIEQVDWTGLYQFSKALESVPTNDMTAFIHDARSLLGAEPDSSWIFSVILVLSKIPADDRPAFIQDARGLITDNMYSHFKFCFLDALSTLSMDNRTSIIKEAHDHFTNDMPDNIKAAIIKALGMIPPDDRKSFFQDMHLLFDNVMAGEDTWRKPDIIESLASFSKADRQLYIQSAQELLSETMEGDAKGAIVEIMFKRPIDELPNLIQAANQLISDKMKGKHQSQIILALLQIPADYLDAFITAANKIITDEMEDKIRAKIIEKMAEGREGQLPHLFEVLSHYEKEDNADTGNIPQYIRNFYFDNPPQVNMTKSAKKS